MKDESDFGQGRTEKHAASLNASGTIVVVIGLLTLALSAIWAIGLKLLGTAIAFLFLGAQTSIIFEAKSIRVFWMGICAFVITAFVAVILSTHIKELPVIKIAIFGICIIVGFLMQHFFGKRIEGAATKMIQNLWAFLFGPS